MPVPATRSQPSGAQSTPVLTAALMFAEHQNQDKSACVGTGSCETSPVSEKPRSHSLQSSGTHRTRSDDSASTASLFGTDCRTLENCPEGYPRLAAFLSSDHNFALYRGFSYAHARVLLALQQEISELETCLDRLDESDKDHDDGRDRLVSWSCDRDVAARNNEAKSRVKILGDLETMLIRYDTLLLHFRDMEGLQKPAGRDYRSVRQYFDNTAPLTQGEMDYMRKREDLVTLRHGRECAGFDSWIESVLQSMNCRLVRYLFMTRDLRRKTIDKDITYFAPSRIDKFVVLVITAVIFVLLIIPVVIMYELTTFGDGNRHSTFSAIGVLIVFTLIFGAAMSLLTRAKRHELFAASAAYCAVLVVFISNFNGNFSS